MAKRSITAWVLGTAGIRMARLDRARDGWQCVDSGAWPLASPDASAWPQAPAQPSADPSVAVDAESVWQRLLRERDRAGDVVLGLPTSRLMVKVLRLPVAARADLADAVALQMDKLSPFAGDEMTVACELLADNDTELTVLAVAAPTALFDPFEAALAAAGTKTARVDVSLLGWWRALRDHEALAGAEGRRVLLVRVDDEWDLVVVDQGVPIFARGLGAVAAADDLGREVTLSLLHAEVEAGPVALREIVVFAADLAPTWMVRLRAAAEASGASARQVPLDNAALDAVGMAWRAAETPGGLDLTPQRWRHQTAGATARRRFLTAIGVAVGIWTALAVVLFGGPELLKRLVAWREGQMAAIAGDYDVVANARERVKLIQAYMDRSHSVLESLRTVTSVQPVGVDLTSLTYRRGESVKLTGEAQDPALVYAFKDGLEKNAPFGFCALGAVSFDASRRKHRFEMDVRFKQGGVP